MMFEELCAIAYQKERVLARRLAKNMGLSEEVALKQILAQSVNNHSLDNLMAERRQLKANTEAKVAARKQWQADKLAGKRAIKLPDPSAWLAWFDGATNPNPGKMGVGGLLRSPEGRSIEISFAAGHGDSNEAEYLALIAVLEEAVRIQPKKIVVFGDSQVVIGDMNNATEAGVRKLQNLNGRARRLVAQLNNMTLTWTPRKKNAEADALSQRALLG